MQIIDKKLAELKPYENNPRNNDEATEYVANSIKEFGFKVPIVIDKDGVIVAGHTRLKAAERLGLETVPCIVADDLTPEQVKAFRLADNKAGELATWDFEKLDIELNGITDIDMGEFGFEDFEIEDEEEEEIIEDEPPELADGEPKAKRGDVYKLGRHRLMCGDSTSIDDVVKLTGGGTSPVINLLITDPPYNVDYTGKTKDALKISNDSMDNDSFHDFLYNAFLNAYTVMDDGAAFYVWYASREVVNFQKALADAGFSVKQELIWNKNSLVIGRQDYQWKHEPCLYGWKETGSHHWYGDRKQTTVIDFDRPTASVLHPTMKPVGLFEYQIKNSSKKGDNVLDLFGGSGTTIMACEQNGRNAFVMEFDPHYIDVIIERWENFTGQKAELISEVR